MAQYYVDFECWVVEARSSAEAETKALDKIKAGEPPKISSVEYCDPDDKQVEYMGEDTDTTPPAEPESAQEEL